MDVYYNSNMVIEMYNGYQIHLTRHQRYINTVYVTLWIKQMGYIPIPDKGTYIPIDDVDKWFDEYENKIYEYYKSL